MRTTYPARMLGRQGEGTLLRPPDPHPVNDAVNDNPAEWCRTCQTTCGLSR